MKRFAFLFLLFLLPKVSAAASFLTLEEALAAGAGSHPRVVEAKEALFGAEARTGEALALYYPQVGISADWSRGRTFLTALEGIRTTEVHSEVLYLKQTIYDFGRTAGAVAAARGNREAADRGVAVTLQDLTLRVRSAFYLALAAQSQVVATRETVKAREEVYRQAVEFFDMGIRAKVEVARAEANLYSARTALIRAENGSELARVELANAMGISSLGGMVLVSPPPVASGLPERDQAHREALANRPELLQMKALESAAAANLVTAKGGYLPVLSGVASVGYADRDFPPGGSVWGVGVNLTIPLFSGGSSVQQVREATAGIRGLSARHESLKLQIAKEVDSAWLGVHEARARMAATEKEVAAAEENRALAEGRYREGVGGIIEVTDAESLALEAATSRIQAEYDYSQAMARLERTLGRP